MFYADKLYWKGANEQESAGNYTLDIERSSCTQNTHTKGDRNATSAMYVFFFNKKKFHDLFYFCFQS